MADATHKPYFNFEKPNLVKEWHPTKNGRLTPKNVSSSYEEKLWWLCGYGHEWEATLQDRLKGDRCPFCAAEFAKDKYRKFEDSSYQQKYTSQVSHNSEKPYPSFQLDSPTYDSTVESRKHPRYQSKVTAMIEDPITGNSVYAQMQNISFGGMYLETNIALKQGENIRIRFNKPLSFTRKTLFPSVVRWCKGLQDDEGHIYDYGLGVKFT
jgi:hypothetical protein